jgi:hypothetical protein
MTRRATSHGGFAPSDLVRRAAVHSELCSKPPYRVANLNLGRTQQVYPLHGKDERAILRFDELVGYTEHHRSAKTPPVVAQARPGSEARFVGWQTSSKPGDPSVGALSPVGQWTAPVPHLQGPNQPRVGYGRMD